MNVSALCNVLTSEAKSLDGQAWELEARFNRDLVRMPTVIIRQLRASAGRLRALVGKLKDEERR